MSAGPSDFIQVQLSPAGVAFAGKGGAVRIANGHFDYTFTASKPVRVLTSEWRKALSLKVYKGAPILEAVAAAAPAAPAKPAPPQSHTVSPAASHTDAAAQPATEAPAAKAAETQVEVK